MRRDKKTIIDYVKTEFRTFNEFEFNSIDALLFSQLAYLNFEKYITTTGVSIASLYKAEEFDTMIGDALFYDSNKELIIAVCASPRYRNTIINYQVDKHDFENEKQFSALTFFLESNEIVIAYRGTDPSLVGWKEDFNMSFQFPVPSQVEALNYLNTIGAKTDNPIILTGHSKGGNLASYAYIYTQIQDRIIKTYDLDGPGFPLDKIDQEKHKLASEKIVKIIPEGSFVGVLLDSFSPLIYVKSKSIGIMQHDLFTWLIKKDEFLLADNSSLIVKKIDNDLNSWVYTLPVEQRKLLIDTSYDILTTCKSDSIKTLPINLIKQRDIILSKIKGLDKTTIKCINHMLKQYLVRNSHR